MTPAGLATLPGPAQLARPAAARCDDGKRARRLAPLESHVEFAAGPDRPDPVALLLEQAESRVPELVPIRHGRMLASPFGFYRGAALVMAADLATTPSSGLWAQACGDAHLANFGVFASPERRLVFSVNDFDESLPGPWEWDVKRLVASFVVLGRARGFTRKQRRKIATRCARVYRESMRMFAGWRDLEVWYARLEVETVLPGIDVHLDRAAARRMKRDLTLARSRDSLQAYGKLTALVDGEPRIRSVPPLIVPLEELGGGFDPELVHKVMCQVVEKYRNQLPGHQRRLLAHFRFVHAARKVVGVGSVGTRTWILLMLGHDLSDPLFLQAKEAQPSVLEPFVGRSEYRNEGERVVIGQRLMQANSDIFLGWDRQTGLDGYSHDYYIRQLRDGKWNVPVEALLPEGLLGYGEICAWTLARAHARSGDRIAIAGYLGSKPAFEHAIAEFAERYADQTDRDFAELQAAARSGRIAARSGL